MADSDFEEDSTSMVNSIPRGEKKKKQARMFEAVSMR
jgi:hypothetical protein